jgi:hypothetical protein
MYFTRSAGIVTQDLRKGKSYKAAALPKTHPNCNQNSRAVVANLLCKNVWSIHIHSSMGRWESLVRQIQIWPHQSSNLVKNKTRMVKTSFKIVARAGFVTGLLNTVIIIKIAK